MRFQGLAETNILSPTIATEPILTRFASTEIIINGVYTDV